jgi:hypothetical protein
MHITILEVVEHVLEPHIPLLNVWNVNLEERTAAPQGRPTNQRLGSLATTLRTEPRQHAVVRAVAHLLDGRRQH